MTAPSPLILHVFSTFAVGGPQVRFAAIANHLGGRLRHAIVAMDGDLACRERLAPGLDVSFPPVVIRKGDTVGNVRRFRRFLRELGPDLLVTSNWGSIEWAIANAPIPLGPARVRHVHVEDGFGPEERTRQLPRRVTMRRLFLGRATVVLPSRTLLKIATETWRLDPRRLRYIPNGIDLSAPPGPSPDFAGEGPVIGTVAALRPEKNLVRLIEAFRLVRQQRPARLVIIGDGAERGALEALACQHGLAASIVFTGHVAAPQRLYAGFDIFALSSDTEQMPLSVLEAMAAGLPIAATDVGDVRTMVAAENARFVGPLDAASLSDNLLVLLGAPMLRRGLGAANRVKAMREFDRATMFHAWSDLLLGRSTGENPTVNGNL